MKTYTVLKNQSIVDVAIQLYGNVDAVPELLALNADVLGLGSDTLTIAEWKKMGDRDLGNALKTGMVLNYDETSSLRNSLVLNVLGQYGNDEGDYILATAQSIPDDMLVSLPDPDPVPDPDPYVFHADTEAFLDAVYSELGLNWEDEMSEAEAIVLDRLVRDLHGETNDDYATEDIWSILKAVYPVVSANAQIHIMNIIAPTDNMSFSGGVTHGLNKIIFDGSTGEADTLYVDGTDTDEADVCMGIVVSNYSHLPAVPAGYPNHYMGASDAGNGVWIRNFNGKYEAKVTTTSGTFSSTTAYQPNEYLHMQGTGAYQSLYLGGSGMLIANKAYAMGTASGANIKIGKVDGVQGVAAEVNFAYIGKALNTAQRKSMMNAVNYFLYQKGVRGSFTAIV